MAKSVLMQPVKRARDVGKLTANQLLFTKALLADPGFNATKAAKAAGYAAPSVSANNLLKNKIVASVIGKAIHDRAAKFEVKADDVLRELMRIALASPKKLLDSDGNLIDLQDLSDDVAASVKTMKITVRHVKGADGEYNEERNTEIQFWDKVTALDLLGKHLGLYEKDNTQQKGKYILDLSAIYQQQRAITEDHVEKLIASPEPSQVVEQVLVDEKTIKPILTETKEYELNEFEGELVRS